MKRFFYLSILIFLGRLWAGPILIYNQYPRVWNMDFRAMASYVPKIKELGFNVVWVNPFFQSSDTNVRRLNKFTGEALDVKGSLYGMKLDAFCRPELQDSPENIVAYTSTVKENGMIPIFDLVLNHVAKDSKLVTGKPDWFKGEDSHWDDICPFNYADHRKEIFATIWQPLLDQMVAFGFQGMRVDYGTDVDQATLKMCIDYLKTRIKHPLVIFGEALIPVGKDVKKVLDSCRNTGFTHLTNLSIFLSKEQILQGKNPTNPFGYEWFLHDLGLKKSTCTGECVDFWTGTVGFSGSHDHGTTILSYFLHQGVTQEDIDNRISAGEVLEDIEQLQKRARGELIQERLSSKNAKQKLEIIKERMAIAAFSSDAGWYCFSSDEWLSEIAKSPFVRSDETPFHREELIPAEMNPEIETFIKAINVTFPKLGEAPGTFWVEMFYSDDASHLIFIRHISRGQLPADIVCVKIKDDVRDYSDEEIKGILSAKNAELHSYEGVAFHRL